ncbi:hypothetical protein M378DRAFT_188368 [Amanita muscaria Koide BX008]|uniref:Uncharacterized protein n=1 Tax=Amanita muscaria (strain Koide BX008) TaxID=946122 RepID=A0A0C2W9G4_AMAMK|nr:hypothetical protein M378DRAFT_188368 [Amanita muscaria Koide BX008]
MSHTVQFKHWDQALRDFLVNMQLTQALRGFENDMLVLNPDWETKTVPLAMAKFLRTLVAMNTTSGGVESKPEEEDKMDVDADMDERKLAYVRPSNGGKPQSPTSINKTISQFIARNRARNDTSNRAEFLRHLDEMRASQPDLDTSSWASCARVDMKTIDREKQMKYDIAKNEDGPLKRTMKDVGTTIIPMAGQAPTQGEGRQPSATRMSVSGTADGDVATVLTADRYPALDERISNIEKHIAVRYVPSPPKSFLDRLKFLEDHLVQLEKDYPPWAAVHFNQPKRTWPPPPRSTPIIVPPHMRAGTSSGPTTSQTPLPTSTSCPPVTRTPGLTAADNSVTEGVPSTLSGGKTKHSTSSLQKAVLEKLEVIQAMNDLAGGNGVGTEPWGE